MLGARLRCQIELLKICCVQALFSCDELSRKKLEGCEKSCSALGRLSGSPIEPVAKLQQWEVGVETVFSVRLTTLQCQSTTEIRADLDRTVAGFPSMSQISFCFCLPTTTLPLLPLQWARGVSGGAVGGSLHRTAEQQSQHVFRLQEGFGRRERRGSRQV